MKTRLNIIGIIFLSGMLQACDSANMNHMMGLNTDLSPSPTASSQAPLLNTGNNILLKTEDADALSCPDGGKVYTFWNDVNNNGVLDANETIVDINTVCNGIAGVNGTNGVGIPGPAGLVGPTGPIGLPGLVGSAGPSGLIGPSGPTGPIGLPGLVGSAGLNGSNGTSMSLSAVSATVGTCPNGGITYKTWIDTNNNNVWDAGEVVLSLNSVCNGNNGVLSSDLNITTNWIPVSDLQITPVLSRFDLTNNIINDSNSDGNSLWACIGSYVKHANPINGVNSGNIRIAGTKQRGTIQFGELKNDVSNDENCRKSSGETFSYVIQGNKMTLCFVNLNYPYCSDYTATH